LYEKKLIENQNTTDNFTFTTLGVILDSKFSNINALLILDGIEILGKNRIIPILLIPFEKVSKADKLFAALQATYLQNEFHFRIEQCKIVYGRSLNQTGFKLTTFSKTIKNTLLN